MVQFLSIFFSWISSIFVGFFKSSRFFVSPCTHYWLYCSWDYQTLTLCAQIKCLGYSDKRIEFKWPPLLCMITVTSVSNFGPSNAQCTLTVVNFQHAKVNATKRVKWNHSTRNFLVQNFYSHNTAVQTLLFLNDGYVLEHTVCYNGGIQWQSHI